MKIVLRTGLYHIIKIGPDAPCALEVISVDGSRGRVPLEPSAFEVPVRGIRHWISPLVRREHLVLSIYCITEAKYYFPFKDFLNRIIFNLSSALQ